MTLPGPSIRIDVRKARKRADIASTTKGKGAICSNAMGSSIPNSINVTITPEVSTNVLTVEVRGKVNAKADMDKDHDEVGTLFSTNYSDELMNP